MAYNDLPSPSVADTPLWRICHALGELPTQLALHIGVEYAELEPLLGRAAILPEIDRDEIWLKIADYTDVRWGQIMAVRAELNRALQRDRVRRLARQQRVTRRPAPPPVR